MVQKNIEDLLPKPGLSFKLQVFMMDTLLAYLIGIVLMIPFFNVYYLRSIIMPWKKELERRRK